MSDDITETVDVCMMPGYIDDGTTGINTITFQNVSSVGVTLSNLRIVQVYSMCNLGDTSCYRQRYPGIITPANGMSYAQREDYPCCSR